MEAVGAGGEGIVGPELAPELAVDLSLVGARFEKDLLCDHASLAQPSAPNGP